MKDEIVRLSVLWYDILNTDSHKDRDCHFYIKTVYSYGRDPVFRVEHFGYISEDIDTVCQTYEEAEIELAKILEEKIDSEVSWAKDIISMGVEDVSDVERAEQILRIVGRA